MPQIAVQLIQKRCVGACKLCLEISKPDLLAWQHYGTVYGSDTLAYYVHCKIAAFEIDSMQGISIAAMNSVAVAVADQKADNDALHKAKGRCSSKCAKGHKAAFGIVINTQTISALLSAFNQGCCPSTVSLAYDYAVRALISCTFCRSALYQSM